VPTHADTPAYKVAHYYFGGKGCGLGNSTIPANRTCAVRQWLRAGTLDRIGVRVTVVGTGSAIRLGIWEEGTDGLPGALLLDAGTVIGTSLGAQEKTISQVVANKPYWFSWTEQGGTPPQLAGYSQILLDFSQGTTAPPGNPIVVIADSNNWSGALGSPFGTIFSNNSVPGVMVFFRYSAIT
jgi:hypothetical protein